MVKMKHIKAYERNNCPDHIVEEVDELVKKMADALNSVLLLVEPNIILSAFNRLHAGMIVTLVSERDEELRNAVIQEIKGLIGNVEDISGIVVIQNSEDKT